MSHDDALSALQRLVEAAEAGTYHECESIDNLGDCAADCKGCRFKSALADARPALEQLQKRNMWLNRFLNAVDGFLHENYIGRELSREWAETLHNVCYEQGKQGPADARKALVPPQTNKEQGT